MISALDVVKDALDQVQAAQNAILSDLRNAEHIQKDLQVRLRRMETRLCRLMDLHGLDEQGQPKPADTVSPDA